MARSDPRAAGTPRWPSAEADPHLHQEWLVTNGLGGYASGTVSGAITRRYHGLLIAALPNPLGRMMMLNGLSERLRLPDRQRGLHRRGGTGRRSRRRHPARCPSFAWKRGCPCGATKWTASCLEKRLLMPHRQNTVHIVYRLLAGEGKLRLGLRPAIHFRPHDAPVSRSRHAASTQLTVCEDQFEISSKADLPPLRLLHPRARRRTSRSTARRPVRFRIPRSAAAATSGRARCGAPAISAPTWAPATRSR